MEEDTHGGAYIERDLECESHLKCEGETACDGRVDAECTDHCSGSLGVHTLADRGGVLLRSDGADRGNRGAVRPADDWPGVWGAAWGCSNV